MKFTMSELRFDFRRVGRRFHCRSCLLHSCPGWRRSSPPIPPAIPANSPAVAAPPVHLTANQDRQRLMDLLGIKELRPGSETTPTGTKLKPMSIRIFPTRWWRRAGNR